MAGRGDGAPGERDLDRSDALDGIEAVGDVDALVDRLLAEGKAETHAEAAEIVASMQRVRTLADEPLPAASRVRHLQRIRTHEVAAQDDARATRQIRRTRTGGFRRRFVVVAAASLAVLMLTAGSAVGLAQGAEPEDLLYGVKRASEQAWLAVPRGSERSAEVHLALAERRLDEARRAPAHAERLVAEGIENAEVAAEELPGEAVENLLRLLGDGPDALPENASPAARAALHRNCVRISDRHDLGPERCGPAPEGGHPGRGRGLGEGVHPGRGRGLDADEHPGQGRGLQGDEHPGQGRGPGNEGHPGQGLGHQDRDGVPRGGPFDDGDTPRGWGPGGRPDGAVGPPPGTPGYERWDPADDEPAEE
jgi:anti-sigma-K factor RskA